MLTKGPGHMPAPARSVTIALTVPLLARARARSGDYSSAEGAAALAERIREAWRARGQPAPEVEIVELRGEEFHAAAGGGKRVLRCPRVIAPGGVPAGYTGRVRVL